MRDGEWAFGALYCSINSFTSSFTVCQGSQPKNSSSPKFMVCHYQMPKTYIKIFHHLFFFEDVSLKFEEIDLVKAGNVWVCCAFGNAFLDSYPTPIINILAQVAASVLTLLAIALERHRAVITPLAPRYIFNLANLSLPAFFNTTYFPRLIKLMQPDLPHKKMKRSQTTRRPSYGCLAKSTLIIWGFSTILALPRCLITLFAF